MCFEIASKAVPSREDSRTHSPAKKKRRIVKHRDILRMVMSVYYNRARCENKKLYGNRPGNSKTT